MEDPKKPRLRCVQIKGSQEDTLLVRLEKYAEKRGLQTATAARLLIRTGLDEEENHGR